MNNNRKRLTAILGSPVETLTNEELREGLTELERRVEQFRRQLKKSR